MIFKNKLIYLTVLCLVLMLGACSDDKGTTPADENSLPAPVDLEAPYQALGASGNEYGSMASGYIAMAVVMSGFFTPLAGADSTTLNDTLIISWTEGDLTVTFKILDIFEGDTWTWWVIVLDGDDGGTIYNDWICLEGEMAKDGSEGWMTLYDENTTDDLYNWEWEVVDDDLTVTMTWSDGDDDYMVIIQCDDDGSGYCEYYEEGIIEWKIDWISSGVSSSGMWYRYEGGVQAESGTWFYSTGD